MENKEVMIRIKNLSKHFVTYYDKPNSIKERIIRLASTKKELRNVLDDISFDVHKGETLALIGINGCGKSTLLKLISKIMYPDKGSIEVNGNLCSLIELGAGFHPDFTGKENIYFNASIFGLTRKEIDERIDKIIEFSELGESINNPIRTYSSGMYMRLAFSVAINVDAEILLFDEILSVGDSYFQEKCFKQIRKLKEMGKTIVIVSHDITIIKNLCTRAIWIGNGKIIQDESINVVCDKYLNTCGGSNESI